MINFSMTQTALLLGVLHFILQMQLNSSDLNSTEPIWKRLNSNKSVSLEKTSRGKSRSMIAGGLEKIKIGRMSN